MTHMNVLILGASYGLLPAVRIFCAGHRVTVVCRPEEQAALAARGAKVSFLKRSGAFDCSLEAAAAVGAATQDTLGVQGVDLDLAPFDIVFLAMTEPQFASKDVADLLRRIAHAKLPVVSLMNALPPAFLARFGTLQVEHLKPAYSAWDVWQDLDPALITAASPDAQAVRADPKNPNELCVTLASNFKIAPFEEAKHQTLIETLAADIAAHRHHGRPLAVRMIAHASKFVPIAKWPMLITGNCRCVQTDGTLISIAEAVTSDISASQKLYDQTLKIVLAAGASETDIVPFAHYLRAARSLSRPSSFARAIAMKAPRIERVDKMIHLAGQQMGIDVPEITDIVDHVDDLMDRNSAHTEI